MTSYLDKLPIWAIFVLIVLATFLALESGFLLGKRRRQDQSDEVDFRASPIVAYALSLLAFMTAIVFGAVESRLNDLKHIVLDEANAIGTAFVRTDLVPEADRPAIQQLISDYLEYRIDGIPGGTPENPESEEQERKELLQELWLRAMTVAEQEPSRLFGNFMQSLNKLIELHRKQHYMVADYRLPGVVWLVLLGLAIVTMTLGGYESALTRSHHSVFITIIGAIAFAAVVSLEIAMDRPQQEAPEYLKAPLIDLQKDIQRAMQSQR